MDLDNKVIDVGEWEACFRSRFLKAYPKGFNITDFRTWLEHNGEDYLILDEDDPNLKKYAFRTATYKDLYLATKRYAESIPKMREKILKALKEIAELKNNDDFDIDDLGDEVWRAIEDLGWSASSWSC